MNCRFFNAKLKCKKYKKRSFIPITFFFYLDAFLCASIFSWFVWLSSLWLLSSLHSINLLSVLFFPCVKIFSTRLPFLFFKLVFCQISWQLFTVCKQLHCCHPLVIKDRLSATTTLCCCCAQQWETSTFFLGNFAFVHSVWKSKVNNC